MFGRKRDQKSGRRKSGGKLEELVLPIAKLRFCQQQLLNLNYIFNKRLQNLTGHEEKSLVLAKSVTERLVQRLVCGAGMLDPRFSSKYLIYNYDRQDQTSNNLSYTMRLDCLSTPTLYQDDPKPKYSIFESESEYPAGYARIKLYGGTLKVWNDFTNTAGYLRRDKVQARFVELLASAASKDTPNSPLHVDESVLCGIPGKVVDNYTFYNILKLPPERHVYYGPGGNVPRFPDTRDFRLAIVDEPDGVRLKVEFLSPALANITIDVRILVVVGLEAWPSSMDFPSRVPLGHPDCLLYQQAAETGMFLVGYGVQSSAWQMRLPAAESVILNHYGSNSTIRTILDVLYVVLEDIDNSRRVGKQQTSYKILTRYIFLTLLLEELETNSRDPTTDMITWSPIYLSTHVLNLLDKVILNLRNEKQPNYFFKKANLMVNPGHLCDEDFYAEANNVKSILVRLFDESLISTDGNEEFERILSAQETELELLRKWRGLIEGLLPPPGTRGRRFCFAGSKNRREVAHTQYTTRQLEYIGMLLKKMLTVKQSILQTDHPVPSPDLDPFQHETALEDVIFILVTVMDQARDQYLTRQTNPNILKNKLKIKSNFNTYTSKLIDQIRRDKDSPASDYEDDLVLVTTILKWLYRAMDQNKRYLGPVLRPYLNDIFSSSHAISWHLDAIKDRIDVDEIRALGTFAELMNEGKITPAEGLIDCVNKGWCWAKGMLGTVERSTLRVVFVSGRGEVYRHILSLPSYRRSESVQDGSKTFQVSERRRGEICRQRTMPNRSYFSTLLSEKCEGKDQDSIPQHDRLRNASSLSIILDRRHRRGEHRGVGDVFKALTSMQKLNMFQEVTSNLPQEDRTGLTELIQGIQTVKYKRSSAKRWSGTLPQTNKISPKDEGMVQRYIPKEESAGIKISGNSKDKNVDVKLSDNSSLLGTCRAVRIKEDSGVFYLHDSFKIKSLLNKSESFRT